MRKIKTSVSDGANDCVGGAQGEINTQVTKD